MELIVCIFAVVLLPGWAIPTFINWMNERDERRYREAYAKWVVDCWDKYWEAQNRDR